VEEHGNKSVARKKYGRQEQRLGLARQKSHVGPNKKQIDGSTPTLTKTSINNAEAALP
jgi:hypothetical protein